jgi:hypothetical protein
MSDYGQPRPPGALARAAVRVAVRLLPHGSARDRYRHEFLAEMYGLSSPAQLRLAAGLLSQSLALRAAIDPQQQPSIAELVMPTPRKRKPILCRTHLHHRWERAFNPEGADYLHCRACGKDRYDVERVDPQVGNFGGPGLGPMGPGL